jgi:hypothetical protein
MTHRIADLLLVDDARTPTARRVAMALGSLGARTCIADTLPAVNEQLARSDCAFRGVAASDQVPLETLERLLAPVSERLANRQLAGFYFGDRVETRRFHELGLRHRLSMRNPSHLRFALNRGLELGHRRRSKRGEPRVAVGWEARAVMGNRAKPVWVYTVSSTGAFLETPRPFCRGVEIRLELELPELCDPIRARVVYGNVPGNLVLPKAPLGMAVKFLEPSQRSVREIHSLIRRLRTRSAKSA